MKNRIFIGVFLPKLLQDIIYDWQKENNHLPVKWIKKENLHLTLIPPWQESNIKYQILNIKNTNLNIKKIQLEFTRLSCGPTTHNPRLIWATGNSPLDLINLSNNLHIILQKSPSQRKLLTHVTIARIKKKQLISEALLNLQETIDWQFKVNNFSLIESKLTPGGACYSEIYKFPLK